MLGIRLTSGVSDTNQIALVLNMGRDQGEMNPGTGNYIPGEGCPVLRGAWLRVSRQALGLGQTNPSPLGAHQRFSGSREKHRVNESWTWEPLLSLHG